MSDAEVVFHPEASEEYSEAYAWYAVRSERVAARVVYREFGDRVWIVAVAHAHSRPGYWKARDVEPS